MERQTTQPWKKLIRGLLHHLGVISGSLGLTLLVLLVLPLMQTISKPLTEDLSLTSVDLGSLEPPPPTVQEEEPEPEEQQEEQPPQLEEMTEAPPLDLSSLELALNPGMGGGMGGGGDFAVNLNVAAAASNENAIDAVFSMADLDQEPRPTYQTGASRPKSLKGKGPAKVYVLFIVDENGRVTDPKVQKSDNPLFDNLAIKTVKKWRFEPGKRAGKPVRFRMRAPISFGK